MKGWRRRWTFWRHIRARFLIHEGDDLGAQRLGALGEAATACSPHMRPPCSVKSISVSGAL
jgi:hypothetical protein